MKTVLESYLDQEIWLRIKDNWYLAIITQVSKELLHFTHATYNDSTEDYTHWEMVVRISEVVAIDRILSSLNRNSDILISKLLVKDN